MKKQTRITYGGSLCLSMALGFTNSSLAAENTVSVDKFELQVFEKTLAAGEIVAGDFSAAVEKILTANKVRAEYTVNTNLCVAYTARGEFSRAEEHCQVAKRLSTFHSRNSPWARTATRDKQALALNNLGVLNALRGNAQEALQYFTSAGSKSRKFEATAGRNITALEQRTAFSADTAS